MASVSFSLARGTNFDLRPEEITVGTSAPGSGDFELRVDVTTNTPTIKDVILALETFILRLEGQGSLSFADFPTV